MTEPILHHYPASPFSEKVRIALGAKGLAWRSVRIPAVMPKPDVVALTGGYRKTPVLQLGNHIFCDTALILEVLERLAPTPPLHHLPAAAIVAQWADTVLFNAAVPVATRPTRLDRIIELMTEEELAKFSEDRKAMREDQKHGLPHPETARAHLPVLLGRIEHMLGHAPYLLGDSLSVADLAVYHCLWFLDMLTPEQLPERGPIPQWMQRLARIGHGVPTDMSSGEALAAARAHGGSSLPFSTSTAPDPNGLQLGQAVRIRAEDYGRDPVEGVLVSCTKDEVGIRREDPRAGTVIVHFPRLGFAVLPRA